MSTDVQIRTMSLSSHLLLKPPLNKYIETFGLLQALSTQSTSPNVKFPLRPKP
jgi:hypothetical protein